MRIGPSNILFLIPALIIGPVLLAVLIIHGMILDRIHVVRRWYKQRAARRSARIGGRSRVGTCAERRAMTPNGHARHIRT
jgi:hypothetical protein